MGAVYLLCFFVIKYYYGIAPSGIVVYGFFIVFIDFMFFAKAKILSK